MSGRDGTGVETISELVDWPWIRNLSRTSSRTSMAGTWTLSKKESSPEIR